MKKILLFIFLLPTLAFAQLELPFPIKLVNPKPVDFWYYESDGTPYDNTGEVISQVLSAIRYRGMTFNVNGVEYWFGVGIADVDLVIKSTAGNLTGAITSSGLATSLGSFTSNALGTAISDPVRTVTGTDAIVQADNGRTIYFNSATPFNFTIDALTINTFTMFRNIGAGTVTFVDGSGVTSTGAIELLANEVGGIEYIASTTPIISVGGGGPTGSGTTNEIPYWVSGDVLGSLSTATYPSLTELSYVKGVTSSLQTQLGTKSGIAYGAATKTGSYTFEATIVGVTSYVGYDFMLTFDTPPSNYPTTLNINGLGAVTLVDAKGLDDESIFNIRAGVTYRISWNGSQLQGDFGLYWDLVSGTNFSSSDQRFYPVLNGSGFWPKIEFGSTFTNPIGSFSVYANELYGDIDLKAIQGSFYAYSQAGFLSLDYYGDNLLSGYSSALNSIPIYGYGEARIKSVGNKIEIVGNDGNTYESKIHFDSLNVRIVNGLTDSGTPNADSVSIRMIAGKTIELKMDTLKFLDLAADASEVWPLSINDQGVLSSAPSGGGGGISDGGDATNADFTASVNTVYNLPAATLSTNRTITIPAGSDMDVIEIYNEEAGFTWNLTGSTVYQSDGTTAVTSLLAQTNYVIRKVSGKWKIKN